MRAVATAALALLCLTPAACGGEDGGSAPAIDAGSPAEERLGTALVDELEAAEEPIDVRLLPPRQLAEIGPITDNLAEMIDVTERVTFGSGRVEVETTLEPGSAEAEETATLICGALIRSGGTAGDVVLGAGGAEIRSCRRADRNYP